MIKFDKIKSETIRSSSEELFPPTNTDDDLKSDAKKNRSRIVTIRYTSANHSDGYQTFNGQIPEYSLNLPAELDIFDRLPAFVYTFCDLKDFLSDLRNVIVRSYLQLELENLILPKLTVSEYSETDIVIDWIFNYFQMYFTFDKNEGNYWGTIMANNEEGEFCNSVIKIRPEKRIEQVQNILTTAVMLLR